MTGERVNNPYRLLETYYKDMTLRLLLEAYHNTDLSWTSDFVDEVYDNFENLDSICKKYNIELHYEEDESDTFIMSAAYNPKTHIYKITLFDNGAQDIMDGVHREKLKIELYEFLVHEETHQQQNQLKSSQQYYYELPEESTREDEIKHFSQKIEIDACARSVAYELYKKVPYDDINDLLKKLMIQDLRNYISLKSVSCINLYKYIGGKIWHRFLSKVHEYLNSPKYIGGLPDYNKWLSDHKN